MNFCVENSLSYNYGNIITFASQEVISCFQSPLGKGRLIFSFIFYKVSEFFFKKKSVKNIPLYFLTHLKITSLCIALNQQRLWSNHNLIQSALILFVLLFESCLSYRKAYFKLNRFETWNRSFKISDHFNS